MTRFKCSLEAEAMWSRLLFLYRLKRLVGDVQEQGHDWAAWSLRPPPGDRHDLGTDARLLFIAAVGCLARLEEQGEPQSIGVALTRQRLGSHGLGAVAKRFGLAWCGEKRDENCTGCQEHNLLNMTKEWLAAALGDDPYAAEQLDLPWLDTMRR